MLAEGYTPASDAVLRAELRVRRGGVDEVLGAIDSTPQVPSFHLQPYLQGTLHAPAVSGDAIVLHIDYASGSADFSVIETHLTVP